MKGKPIRSNSKSSRRSKRGKIDPKKKSKPRVLKRLRHLWLRRSSSLLDPAEVPVHLLSAGLEAILRAASPTETWTKMKISQRVVSWVNLTVRNGVGVDLGPVATPRCVNGFLNLVVMR